MSTTIEGALSAQIDDIFSEWDRIDSPGMAVAVIHNGEIIHQRGYGMSNLDHAIPIESDSVFHVASVSKQFTAFAIALLAHDGKLSLDDDLRTHVPELPDLGQTITIRHCIHHTSGLRDQYGLFRLAGWRDDDTQTLADVLDFAYRHERLNFTPGDEYRYCNTSYTLLALIVERVSGQSFRSFVNDRLLAPLGMTDSHIHDDHTAIVPRRTSAYNTRDDGSLKVANSTVSAVGAICLFTTAEDLAKWVRNYQTRDVAGDILDAAFTSGALNSGHPTHYGYGLALSTYRGLRTIGHGGSDSGYRAQVTWFPDADLGVVILANLATIKPGPLALRIADIVIPDQLGADDLADASAIDLDPAALKPLTGVYHTTPSQQIREVTLDDNTLHITADFGDKQPMTPLGHRRFRADDPPFEVTFTGPDTALELHITDRNGDTRSFTR
ncbi:MAG TPA: serine hydrolase domain-containing protein, partial [Thermomicrobiales bacterium]|nr:serine hydrolase domain-containing protein [Thermomicrobiales bacterium]